MTLWYKSFPFYFLIYVAYKYCAGEKIILRFPMNLQIFNKPEYEYVVFWTLSVYEWNAEAWMIRQILFLLGIQEFIHHRSGPVKYEHSTSKNRDPAHKHPKYKMLTYVSAPSQLEQVRNSTNGDAIWQLYYESCLEGIHAKQISTNNIYKSTTQQQPLHQWVWRSNHYLQLVQTASGYMSRFTIW
jgi:hypothetical protein